VRVRDDDAGCGDPAGSLDSEPAGGAGDADDGAAGGLDRAGAGDRGIGCRCHGRGAGERPEGIDAGDGVDQRSRRHALVDRGEDDGALDVPPGLCLPGQVEDGCGDDPAEREPGGGAEQEPACGVERAQRRDDEERRADDPTRDAGEAADQRADEHGADERGDRDPLCLVVGEQPRPDLGAEPGSADQPGEREDADHEPAPQPCEREQHDRGERDPVDDRHPDGYAFGARIPAGADPRPLPRGTATMPRL
jgi:hypothetical protein